MVKGAAGWQQNAAGVAPIQLARVPKFGNQKALELAWG